MKRSLAWAIRLVVAVLFLCTLGRGQTGTGVILKSGGNPVTFGNPLGVYVTGQVTLEESVSGSPSTVNIVAQGCMRGGTCVTVDTNTTVGNLVRTPVLTTVYDYFAVAASWTGGSIVSVTVNATISPNLGGGSSGSGLPIYTVSTLPPSATTGTVVSITDGASSTDCTVGHGSTLLLCRYNGSAWGTYPSGAATAGGTNGQGQYNNSNALAGWTASGDCTINFTTGSVTCTKSGGVAFGTAAFATISNYVPTSTTVNSHSLSSNVTISAGDLTTGTLPHAQLPTLLSGDIPNNAANTTGTAAGLSSAYIDWSAVSGGAFIQNKPTLGTFAAWNYATPPAIGGTTPAAGAFTTLSASSTLTTNMTGGPFCVHETSGVLSATAADCGSGGGLSDPGSNGIVKRTALNTTSVAAYADIVALFSSCSGTQYLGYDGNCHTASGSGTVTVVGSGALTSTALVTGGGTTTTQTPNSSATLDPSGNLSIPGTFTGTGSGGWTVVSLDRTTPTAPAASHTTVYTKSGSLCSESPAAAETCIANLAPLASPTFTGTPTVPGYTPTSTTVNGHALSSNVTVVAGDITSGQIGLAYGGTGVDLSGSGGTANTSGKFVVKQDASHVITSAALVTQDLPSASTTRSATLTDLAPVAADSGLLMILDPSVAIHITRLFCAVQGSTNVVLNLDKRTEAAIATDTGNHLLGSDLTAVTGGANTSTFANGAGQCGGTTSCAVAAHAPIVMTFTSVSGTPTALDCGLDYTVD